MKIPELVVKYCAPCIELHSKDGWRVATMVGVAGARETAAAIAAACNVRDELVAALAEIKRTWNATDGSEKLAFQMMNAVLAKVQP